jgi:DNA-binding NarL/FixJ family response regulator
LPDILLAVFIDETNTIFNTLPFLPSTLPGYILYGGKMINTIINDENKLYSHGMKIVVEHLFHSMFRKNTLFHSKLDNSTVVDADIIIMSLNTGDKYVCHPILRQCKKNALIIGLYERTDNLSVKRLPHCLDNMVFIHRSASIESIKKTIANHWAKRSAVEKCLRSCKSCNYSRFSSQQIIVVERYFRGEPMQQIASDLNLSSKTVFSHKRVLMKKFDLHTDYELVNFLARVNLGGNIPGTFRGCTKRVM